MPPWGPKLTKIHEMACGGDCGSPRVQLGGPRGAGADARLFHAAGILLTAVGRLKQHGWQLVSVADTGGTVLQLTAFLTFTTSFAN